MYMVCQSPSYSWSLPPQMTPLPSIPPFQLIVISSPFSFIYFCLLVVGCFVPFLFHPHFLLPLLAAFPSAYSLPVWTASTSLDVTYTLLLVFPRFHEPRSCGQNNPGLMLTSTLSSSHPNMWNCLSVTNQLPSLLQASKQAAHHHNQPASWSVIF